MGASFPTCKPDTLTSPEDGFCSPMIRDRMEDFPAPEWPVRKTNWPLGIWKETSWRPWTPFG